MLRRGAHRLLQLLLLELLLLAQPRHLVEQVAEGSLLPLLLIVELRRHAHQPRLGLSLPCDRQCLLLPGAPQRRLGEARTLLCLLLRLRLEGARCLPDADSIRNLLDPGVDVPEGVLHQELHPLRILAPLLRLDRAPTEVLLLQLEDIQELLRAHNSAPRGPDLSAW
eukprot:5644001-Prymnesium_polylepis.1